MVKIIDGEIVRDDDPRLQRRQGTVDNRSARSAAGQQTYPDATGSTVVRAAQTAVRPAFNLAAPPVRLVSAGNGQFPDAEVFGVAVPGLGLVALAAAGLIFGWRGLLGGALLGYLYLMNRPAAGGSGRQNAGISAGANLWNRMQKGLEPDNNSYEYQQASKQQQDAASSNSSNTWAGLGKGHKLGTG